MSWLITHWPEWTRPYWLLCIPVSALLLWALYRVHQSQYDWRSLLPQAFHAVLLNIGAPRQRNARYFLLGCAWLSAVLALMGPSWEKNTEQSNHEQHLAPLVIVIQLTHDVLANDLPPSRLHHIREKILKVLEKRDAAYTALVVYSGSAHTLVPLSNDLLTSQNLLQALQPDLMPTPGLRADLAIERAIKLLQQGAQGEGQILLISTGVSVHEQTKIQKLLKPHAIHLNIMGVGSTDGAPLTYSIDGHFLTDTSGAIVISRLNETSLQLLAKQTSSPYVQLRLDDSDLAALDIFTQTESSFSTGIIGHAAAQQDQGYWFILPILLLAATFARRGSLLLILVCLLPMSSFAFELEHLWLRPDQQGAKLLEQQPELAAEHFTDPLWRATALYLAEDYQAAAELFADFDTAEAHYNRGNALALSGLLPEALKAYQYALSQAPDMLAAQYNIAVVKEQLKTVQESKTDNKETSTPKAESASAATESFSATTSSAAATTTPESSQQNGILSTEPKITPSQGLNSTLPSAQLSPQNPTAAQQPETRPTEPSLHLESWLEQIPDNPSELLKRKFWYEQSMQESAP